jgi:hypothetical protein
MSSGGTKLQVIKARTGKMATTSARKKKKTGSEESAGRNQNRKTKSQVCPLNADPFFPIRRLQMPFPWPHNAWYLPSSQKMLDVSNRMSRQKDKMQKKKSNRRGPNPVRVQTMTQGDGSPRGP